MICIKDSFYNYIIVDRYKTYARVTIHTCMWGSHSGGHIELFPDELRALSKELNKAADEAEGKV